MAILARLGLLSLALLLFITSYASAADTDTDTDTHTKKGLFSFPSCVAKCVQSTDDCPKAGPRCICRASKTKASFLTSILECMSSSCPSELFRDADDNFLDIMESGCEFINRAIDDDIIDKAEEYASQLWDEKYQVPQKGTTTDPEPAKATTTTHKHDDDKEKGTTTDSPPKATTTSSSESETETETETPSPSVKSPPGQTSKLDRGGAGGGFPATTEAVVPNTPPAPAPTAPPANQGGGNGGFVDDSPFGNPNPSGASSTGAVMGFITWAALVVALLI